MDIHSPEIIKGGGGGGWGLFIYSITSVDLRCKKGFDVFCPTSPLQFLACNIFTTFGYEKFIYWHWWFRPIYWRPAWCKLLTMGRTWYNTDVVFSGRPHVHIMFNKPVLYIYIYIYIYCLPKCLYKLAHLLVTRYGDIFWPKIAQVKSCCVTTSESNLIRNTSFINYQIRKNKDYVYGSWLYKALGIWKGYYRVKRSLVLCMKPWTKARNHEYMKSHSIIPKLHTNCHFKIWAEKWTIMQEASGSSIGPNAARRIIC